jgi:gliding motility-associated-like protein
MSFVYPSGGVYISFWMYRDPDYATSSYAAEGVEVLLNTTASTTGATSLGFIPRAMSLAPAVPAQGWYKYTFLAPATFNGASNVVIFSGTSKYGNHMYIDDVEVTHLNDCTGTPTAGTAYTAVNTVCPSVPVTLNDTGYTTGVGKISFQWQSSPAGANTWANIPGATSTSYTVSGITAATDYRMVVTCGATSASVNSNVVSVTLKNYLDCYCTSAALDPADDDIGRFTVGNYFANPATAPTPLTNNSSSNRIYTNFTALGPIQLVRGVTTPFTITQINSGSYYTTAISLYIDYNHNGLFTDAGENVYNSPGYGPASPVSPTFSASFAVPATALTGIARMRVIMSELSTNTPPCGDYDYGETEDYYVNINPAIPPAPTLSSNSPVCQKNAITITATGVPAAYPNPSYRLTGPGISAITSTTGNFQIPAAACANGGTYTVTVTSNAQTSAAATIDVVVNCTPSISVTNILTPTTCLTADGGFQITGLSPTTSYTMSYIRNGVGPTTASITSNASGVANVALTSGNYTQVFVKTAAGCNSDTVATTIQVPAPNPPPTPIVLVNPQPVCQGNTVNLVVASPSSAGTYSWTGPNGYTNTGTSISIPNFTASLNGVYTVTVTVLGCVSAPANSTLTLIPPSPRPVRNNVTYCQFEPAVAMTAQTLPGYFVEWFDTCSSGPGCVNGLRSRGSTPTNPNAPIPNTNVPGIVMWLVRQSAPNGCPSAFDSVYVRVLPRPLTPAVTSTIEYCQYQVVGPLTANGTSLRWFTTPTGGTGTSTAPTPSTLIPGTYHFYVSQTSTEGCESERSQITVVIKPKPEPPTVTSPINLCQGDPAYQLNAVGRDLLWYTLPSGGTGVPVAPVISTNYEDSFFYFVTQSVNGCESDRALIGSYVRYKPNGVITTGSQSICQNSIDTFYYYGNGRPDAEYVWFAPLSSQFISGQGTPGPVVIHFDTAGTSTVQLIVNNKGCISKLLAAPITVRPLPSISFINRQDACADELIEVGLTRNDAGITSYQWDFGADATIVYGEVRTAGPFGIRYPGAGHYQVSAAATKNGCTSVPKVQDIYVHSRPNATISYAYRNGTPLDQFCASDTLSLSVQAVPEGATYTWTPGAYFQDRRDTLNNEVRAVVSRSSYVHVAVKNAFGCESMDSLYVPTKSCCGVYFPNAFTPGSAIERNRIFKPITNGIHRINNFRVMNRWGQVIWETTSSGAGWDGTYRGVPQEMGTYYFYINYRCEDKNVEDQGELILIR